MSLGDKTANGLEDLHSATSWRARLLEHSRTPVDSAVIVDFGSKTGLLHPSSCNKSVTSSWGVSDFVCFSFIVCHAGEQTDFVCFNSSKRGVSTSATINL